MLCNPQDLQGLDSEVRVMTSTKNYETYILRDIQKGDIISPGQLKAELYRQFGPEILSENLNFGVGCMNGNSKVSIRSSADIEDVWRLSSTCKEEGIVLWCERTKKRNYISSDESDEDIARPQRKSKKKKLSALEDKNNRVEGLVETLKKKHQEKFTTMQYRLWAEVLDGGTWK